jgi:hypothetical protein
MNVKSNLKAALASLVILALGAGLGSQQDPIWPQFAFVCLSMAAMLALLGVVGGLERLWTRSSTWSDGVAVALGILVLTGELWLYFSVDL